VQEEHPEEVEAREALNRAAVLLRIGALVLEREVDPGVVRAEAGAPDDVRHVEDARAFGLVATGPDGRVVAFREKPEEPVEGDVNAGTYVLEPRALAAWSGIGNVSIERRIFPSLIAAGRLVFGFVSGAYWLDLGTPETYLRAHFDILEGKVRGEPHSPAPFVADGAVIDLRAHLGRWVVVGAGARVRRAILDKNVRIPEGATIGYDLEQDKRLHHVTEKGIVVVEGARSSVDIAGIVI